jgi:uncharacterized protein (TIGR02646 family)
MGNFLANYPLDTAAAASESDDVWARFRSDQAYGEIVEALAAVQGGLCLYCERRLTTESGQPIKLDYQVEHVLPKSSGNGRTLDWTNLALCCGGGTYAYHADPVRQYKGRENVSCGQQKGDAVLGVGCDPRDFPLSPRLVDVGLDGALSANSTSCATVGISESELNRTINEVLNLNCERLKVARKNIADNVREWVVGLIGQALGDRHLTAPQQADFAALLVAGRLQPDGKGHLRAFWTTERQYLEPWSETWLAQNGFNNQDGNREEKNE